MESLGSVLIIANPTARSGKGLEAIHTTSKFLEEHPLLTSSYKIQSTTSPTDAYSFACKSHFYDTVIVLGGDGTIHEVVQGLMTLDSSQRPLLGILAMGSGNDFARTLQVPWNNIEESLKALTTCKKQDIEIGKITNEINQSSYFMQTLSFGLDAAIAIDTNKRRIRSSNKATNRTSTEMLTLSHHASKRAGRKYKVRGSALFITSGISLVAQHTKSTTCSISFDNHSPITTPLVMCAIQVGPTYGGGFKVCPQANPTDNLLDCCYNIKQPSTLKSLLLFAKIRQGTHLMSEYLTHTQFSHMTIQCSERIPIQIDGEEFQGLNCKIEVIPRALQVLSQR